MYTVTSEESKIRELNYYVSFLFSLPTGVPWVFQRRGLVGEGGQGGGG